MTLELSKNLIWRNYSISSVERGYLENSAISLIEYANINKQFAIQLLSLINALPPKTFMAVLRTERIIKTLPENIDDALRKSRWLFERLEEEKSEDSNRAAEILSNWARDKEREFPRNIIIGIKVGIIPGFTLGNIKTRKNANILLNPSISFKNSIELAKLSSRAALALLQSALKINQDIKKLEPDIADWFFGDKEIKFYSTSGPAAIAEIQAELNKDAILYALARDKHGKSVAICLSPAVNLSSIDTRWCLEPLGQDA